MASIVGKRVNGRTYYYLASSARVSGRPRIVSQRYLGSADEIAAAVTSPTGGPVSTSHLPFGDVAAAWQTLNELRLADIVDEAVGSRRATVSAGRLLAIAVLHRIAAPASTDLPQWWPTTSAARFVRPRVSTEALAAKRMRRVLARVTGECLPRIEAALFRRVRELLGGDEHGLVVDIPDFVTYAERGDATATRLAGLALVVSLDGTVPLLARPYLRGDDAGVELPDLASRYHDLTGGGAVTVVAGAGQDTPAGRFAPADRHFVGPLPPSDHPDLIAARLTVRRPVDPRRLPGVTALDGRGRVAGTERRIVCVHSANLQAAQSRALARDLAHATRRLDELATALRSGSRHWSRADAAAEVGRITRFRWGDRVLSTRLTTDADGRVQLGWHVDERALARLRSELFGKQLLTTDHDDWPVPQVITAYRARYHLESTLRYLGGDVVADGDVAAHALVTVLATTVMHLMRHRAQRAGLDLSVRELFDALGGVQETALRYPSTGGRPRTRHVLADRDEPGRRLYDLFGLSRYAPPAST
ncbi:MAG TPA: hypothetical protein VF053_18720 [Streptosporangiales bacterium]